MARITPPSQRNGGHKILTMNASVDEQESNEERKELLKHLQGRIGNNLLEKEREETVNTVKQIM